MRCRCFWVRDLSWSADKHPRPLEVNPLFENQFIGLFSHQRCPHPPACLWTRFSVDKFAMWQFRSEEPYTGQVELLQSPFHSVFDLVRVNKNLRPRESSFFSWGEDNTASSLANLSFRQPSKPTNQPNPLRERIVTIPYEMFCTIEMTSDKADVNIKHQAKRILIFVWREDPSVCVHWNWQKQMPLW